MHSLEKNPPADSSIKPLFFNSPEAPAPIGHYCHAVALPNGLVQLSGQKAWRPEDGQLIDGGIGEQTRLVLSNIRAVLSGMNLDLRDVTRLICHLNDPVHYPEFNAAYAEEMGENKPARAVLAGAELRGGALVEIFADAFDRSIFLGRGSVQS